MAAKKQLFQVAAAQLLLVSVPLHAGLTDFPQRHRDDLGSHFESPLRFGGRGDGEHRRLERPRRPFLAYDETGFVVVDLRSTPPFTYGRESARRNEEMGRRRRVGTGIWIGLGSSAALPLSPTQFEDFFDSRKIVVYQNAFSRDY